MQVTTTIDGASLHVRIENDSDATVHIFDSARMPYFILDDADLLVLFGVNAPDPEVDYFMVEIPTTRPLDPGESRRARPRTRRRDTRRPLRDRP